MLLFLFSDAWIPEQRCVCAELVYTMCVFVDSFTVGGVSLDGSVVRVSVIPGSTG